MKTKLTILFFSGVFACNLATAYTPDLTGRFFLNPYFGVYFPGGARESSNFKIQSGIEGISGGYHFNQYLSTQASLAALNINAGSYLAHADVLASLPSQIHFPFMPYLAAGFGAIKYDRSSLAVDAGGGLKYYVNENAGFNADYRWVGQVSHGRYDDQILDFGFIWTFDKRSSAPAPVAAVAPLGDYKPKELTPVQEEKISSAQKTLKDVLPEGVHECGVEGATPQDGCVTVVGDQLTMHLDVKFQKNKAQLSSRFSESIDRLASFMKTYPTTNTTLFGYASSEGPASFNQRLSLDRATRVKSYLVTKDIEGARLKTTGMGTQYPIADNSSEEGRAKNRRVEAVVPVPVAEQK